MTFVEAMAGFVIGSAAGVGLAIVAGLNEPFRRYIQPYILVPQVTPRVALTPILIAWLGFGWSPKIAIAALICFFPPFVNTVTGMLSVDEEGLRTNVALKLTHLGRWARPRARFSGSFSCRARCRSSWPG